MKVKSITALLILVIIILESFISVNAESGIYDGYTKISESENLILYYSYASPSIIVKDKRNGFLWYSAVKNDAYKQGELTRKWETDIKSLLAFYYTNYSKINYTNSALEKSNITVKNIDKGIRISYNFINIKIAVTLEIRIDKDSLIVNVPVSGIKENGDWGIARIEVLPFFGAASNREKGYIFYPDGSGALLYFQGRSNKDAIHKYSWQVYGADVSEIVSGSEQPNTLIPVFGIRIGDNAFAAIVTRGEYDTAINLYPSGQELNISRISPEFIFRREYPDINPALTMATHYEKEIVREDHSVKYTFLCGEKANYSGMACTYRNYLVANGDIKKSASVNGKIPLGLDLFMGIKEKRILFDKFISMTTFKQAEYILEKFKENKVDNMETSLIGWTKKGYGTYPAQFPPGDVFGGEKGLKQLADYTSGNDIRLLLQANFSDALKSSGGFSIRNDVVYLKNKLALTDSQKNEYFLNPVRSFMMFKNSFLPNLKKYNLNGLNIEILGHFLYADYNRKYPVTRKQAAEYWNMIIKETIKQNGYCAVDGGNAYVLKYADRLYNIPVEDSGYFISDESVPFYQMVVHGIIPYSSDAGNLFYDFPRQKLKWVEYGCMPYFELTYQKSYLLRLTDYNFLFTSYYKDWINTASDIYREFNDRLGNIWSSTMEEHIKINENLYKTTYRNGSAVYVNYNEKPVTAEGHMIKAMDYLAVDKGGMER